MEIFRTKGKQLSERLDPGFYRPSLIQNEVKIHRLGAQPLKDLYQNLGIGHTAAVTPYYTTDPNGIPFVSGGCIVGGHLDVEGAEKICHSAHTGIMNGSRLESGSVIFVRKGELGNSCVIPENIEANCSSEVVFLKLNQGVNPWFVSTYLNSRHGRMTFLRQQRGMMITSISLYDVPEIPVPKLDNRIKEFIGNKVQQAERMRAWAKDSSKKLADEISNVFAGNPTEKMAHRSYISSINSFDKRLDAEFYSPEVLWAEREIKTSKYPHTTLGEVALRIKDGPGGWGVSTNDYRPTGVPVIRSVNIIDGECDLRDCVYISQAKHQELISHEAKRGSVLLSVRGTVGRAAVFNDSTYQVASLNAAVVTIDCKEIVNPYYLAAFLNSNIGKIQSNRIANGAVQLNMNLSETASNLVVLPPTYVQEEIARIYREKITAKNLSQKLTTTAKLLVEALIEGQISEADLIAAQQQLEAGDTSLDRAILSRLKTDGINGTSQPMFADLDELYRLLTQAAGE